MLGDTTDTVWGVMDIYPLTDFPDIRRKCTIHSSLGNLVIIPREGGSLCRFYIQLPPGSVPKQVTLADLHAAARAIFAPYSMDFADTFWWSAYAIGQRLADKFHKESRVFLTGDACHTHSPKAGQGMNVSLQDGYNIGWKLGSVLSGLSPPSILESYVSERGKTAKDLIAFDRELTQLFARKERYEGEFQEYFVKSGRYMAGFTAAYGESLVTGKGGEMGGARGVQVGKRFPSAQVVRFCDARGLQLQSVCRSDGRWRVVVFAGDIISSQRSRERLDKVCTLPFPITFPVWKGVGFVLMERSVASGVGTAHRSLHTEGKRPGRHNRAAVGPQHTLPRPRRHAHPRPVSPSHGQVGDARPAQGLRRRRALQPRARARVSGVRC